jgi:biotin operon repressor
MKEKVYEAFVQAGAPKRPGEIAKALDMDSKEVSKCIADLRKEGRLMSPKRCYYAPAESQ